MGVVSTIAENLAKSAVPTFGKFVEEQPGLFSKLASVVNNLGFSKMDSRQLHKTLMNKGVTSDEIADTLGGLSGSVSKEQVLDRIGERGIKTEDVVLGETKPNVLRFKDFVDEYREQNPTSNLSYPQLQDIFYRRIEDINDFNAKNATHYSTWVAPGAKEGSYREMFVTAPSKEKSNALYFKSEDEALAHADQYPNTRFTLEDVDLSSGGLGKAVKLKSVPGWKDGHSQYDNIQNPIVRIRFNDRIIPDNRYVAGTDKGYGVFDGESNLLSDHASPIEARAKVDQGGKKILFVEEIQGPQGDQKYQLKNNVGGLYDTKEEALIAAKRYGVGPSDVEKIVQGEQGKMPPALQERIYDIGVKRILSYAKENGYDGVAWTPGKMQADRYSLAKHVNRVEYWPENNTLIAVDHSGNQVISEVVPPDKVADYIGKSAAAKLLSVESAKGRDAHVLKGLDLEIGGEGLKSLYDVRIPSLFKKYGKGEIETIKIRHDAGVGDGYINPDYNIGIGESISGIRDLISTQGLRAIEQRNGPNAVKNAIKLRARDIDESKLSLNAEQSARLAFLRDGEFELIGTKPIETEVPFIPITKDTPSRYPLYAFPPALLAAGLGAQQFGPNYFQNKQIAVPRGM